MPEVPTIAESGLPGFEVGAWYGLLAPAGTPRAVIERVSAESARILKLPDVRERFRADAFDIAADTPEQFAAVIRAELARWAPIVKAAGIKPE
jgi:tripartite-type tricarboxylate transporter receptor subunit TctC